MERSLAEIQPGETRISGNIIAKPDKYYPEGETYVICSPITNQGWGIPVTDLQPEDLRHLADRIEEKRPKMLRKFRLQIKRFEEYIHVTDIEALSLEQAVDLCDDKVTEGEYDDYLEKGYDQCYHEIEEVKDEQ